MSGRSVKKGKRPQNSGNVLAVETKTTTTAQNNVKFCLNHMQSGFSVEDLSKEARAEFAMALFKRRGMTWTEIQQAPKHGLGSEKMPASSIRAAIPRVFGDVENFLVLRYSGLLPMAGVRVGDVYHIVWLEPQFGDLYDHG
ncbi:hypothetical protein [Paenarthrobacter sp.]|uniref:hypothetical protein n=1 Tax=Paenarthrobacter sp. TaxID=1931993 RepID=UPI002812252B|nr:hypothetical protein [Paenarthrobacter sp.]